MSQPSAKNSPTEGGNRRPRLAVSFHDVAPHSRLATHRFLADCAAAGIERVSLLVVPHYHDACRVDDDPALVGDLRKWAAAGHDICLHGWRHLGETARLTSARARFWGSLYTAGEGEFQCLDEPEATRRVQAGLALLRDQLGLPVVGFTPPAWLINAAGLRALRACGFRYNTRWAGIDLLAEDRFLPAPPLVYSVRAAWRRLASLAWVRVWAWRQRHAPILRLAIHPVDYDHPAILASLRRFLRLYGARREVVTYRDLAG